MRFIEGGQSVQISEARERREEEVEFMVVLDTDERECILDLIMILREDQVYSIPSPRAEVTSSVSTRNWFGCENA